jgi:hypothetical protein
MTSKRSMRSATMSWLFAALLCFAFPSIAAEPTTDQEKVVETVRSMYAALTEDDPDKFRAVTYPDFYAFEIGKRMTGDQLMSLIMSAHAAGKTYVWSVTEPQVYVDGKTAWITYVNRGSVQDASGKKDVSWLESAVLRKESGTWLIHFFHTTRVPSE